MHVLVRYIGGEDVCKQVDKPVTVISVYSVLLYIIISTVKMYNTS